MKTTFARPQALLVFCALALAAPAAVALPPSTQVRPVTETMHGVEFVDNYRWLEGDNSDPARLGRMNDEVAAWTDAQNGYTRSVLDNLPGRAELEARLRPLMQLPSVSSPAMRGNFYFYTKREGTQAQPVVYVREGHDGASRVLLDVTQIDPSGLTALGGLAPSQDGTLTAFGTYRAGDENTTIEVMETRTGKKLDVRIEGKAGVIEWLPDNSGFFYRRLENVDDPYSAQIRFHRLGTDPSKDPVLFRQFTMAENEALARTWGPHATVSRDGRWMVLYYWTGTSSNDLWAIDLTKWFKDGTFEKREIKVGAPNTFFGEIEGDTLYMITDYGAPKKRVVAVDLTNPAEGGWREVVPERTDAVLQSGGLAKGLIAAEYEEKASTRIRLYGLDGSHKGELAMPGIGSGGLSVSEDRTEAFLSFTSFNYPTTIFRVDLAKPGAEPAVWERPQVPVDPSIIEVKQETYSSKDGTPVTMFIVHKKGLELTGNNPTILYGYGGFNISMTPSFSATLFTWLEDGGVYAMPNLRGGGEYGQEWHTAGMLGNKQNVFDDFIAAAEWLIDNRYTSSDRLAISGGSNGGLLTGAMVVQRPELFRAVIVGVPLLDMLRYQDFLMARYWVPEYGDPANAEHFQWLRAYSPYHNIKQGVAYPAVYVTAGENDTRVHPMHARKYAAALQAATASDQRERPILLWVDRDAGHGAGKPLELRIRDVVDSRMFLMWQLGMLEEDAPARRGDAGVGGDAGEVPTITPVARTVSLRVDGMTCGMCVEGVTKVLKAVPGVKDARVSLEGHTATVTLEDESSVSADTLVKAFDGTKYTAKAN